VHVPRLRACFAVVLLPTTRAAWRSHVKGQGCHRKRTSDWPHEGHQGKQGLAQQPPIFGASILLSRCSTRAVERLRSRGFLGDQRERSLAVLQAFFQFVAITAAAVGSSPRQRHRIAGDRCRPRAVGVLQPAVSQLGRVRVHVRQRTGR